MQGHFPDVHLGMLPKSELCTTRPLFVFNIVDVLNVCCCLCFHYTAQSGCRAQAASSTRARHAWHGPSKLFCRLNCRASGRGAALPSTGQPLGANELPPAAHPACAPAHGRGSICTPHSQAPCGQKRKQSVVDKAFGQLHACAFVKPS